jgi:hypothetical protein
MTSRFIPQFAIALAAGLALASTAQASTDPLTNGGFEQGLLGWTAHGSFRADYPLYGTYAHTGAHYAASSTAGCLCADLITYLNTTAGQSYDLSFWILGGGTGHKEMMVQWGNQVVLDVADTSFANAYTQYSFSGLEATGAQTLLKFFSRNDPNSNGIDDISVTLHASTSPVPEGQTSGLMLAGLSALALVARRQRRTAV